MNKEDGYKFEGFPKALVRDDGVRFLLNEGENEVTYTMEGQKETMPTTFYRYTYHRLICAGLKHGE